MRSNFSSGKTFQVFIGGKGTRTSLHSASENNLFTQVYGRKHWYLYPPDYDIVFTPPITRSPYFHSQFDPDNPDYESFPNTKFILHIDDNLDRQSKSAWWQGNVEKSKEYLRKTNIDLINYSKKDKDCYLSYMKNLFKIDEVKKIFEFLDETFDEEEYNQIIKNNYAD
mgnify:CR=1 FL=1